jgi:hypothetical protein
MGLKKKSITGPGIWGLQDVCIVDRRGSDAMADAGPKGSELR